MPIIINREFIKYLEKNKKERELKVLNKDVCLIYKEKDFVFYEPVYWGARIPNYFVKTLSRFCKIKKYSYTF